MFLLVFTFLHFFFNAYCKFLLSDHFSDPKDGKKEKPGRTVPITGTDLNLNYVVSSIRRF